MLLRLIMFAAAVLALPPSVVAGPHPSRAVVQDRITLAGKQIPLPEGQWRVAGHGYGARHNPDSEAYGAIENLVLLKQAGSVVEALAVISTNVLETSRGWDFAKECRRDDFHLAEAEPNGTGGSCLFVTHVVSSSGAGSSKAWLGALDLIETEYLAIPTTWVVGGFTIANRADFVDVRYYFNPDVRGLRPPRYYEWSRNDWHKDNVEAFAEKRRFVDTVIRWARAFRHYVDIGLRGKLDGVAGLPLPWTLDDDAHFSDASERLLALRHLHEIGAITDQAYAEQSELVLATHAVEPDPGASWKTALAKTLSWRALATTDTMLISYIMSGDLRVAGSIALAEVVSKMAAYFGHELAWDYFRAHGKDAVNAIELDTAGTNRGSTNEKPRGGVTGLLSGLLPPSWSRSVGSWLPEPPDPTPAAKPTAQPRSRDWLPDSWLPSNWFSSDAGAIKK